MADFTPTVQQRDAVVSRNASLLISAGAGSGKTRVLTERLMSYLNDEALDCNITDFLIITFSRAAAVELRSRILSAISAELVKNPKNRRLRRQAALVHSAEIDTIHSFCGRIVRENAHKLNIPPDFRIAEENECDSVKHSVMSRLLDSRYDNISSYEGFELLVDTLSPGRDDSRLTATALDIYGKLSSHENVEQWMKSQLAQRTPGAITDAAATPWGALLLGKVKTAALYHLRQLEFLQTIADETPEFMRAYGDCISSATVQLHAFVAACDSGWDDAMNAAEFDISRAKPLRGDGFDDVKAMWKSTREELSKLSKFFTACSAELLDDMAVVFPAEKALFALITDFTELYLEEKNHRRIVDFSDLEHFALKLLTDDNGDDENSSSPLAAEISMRYVEIMVDEYQDVSAIQEHIFGAVSREGKNLVMVGDVRQSIYRFRLAEPSIFLGKYNSFSDETDAPERRIILADNFRSQRNILDAVNFVFRGVMSEQFGEMNYTEREYLRAGRVDADGSLPVELCFIAPDESADDPPDKRVLEAQYVAKRIGELVSSGYEIPDGDRTRPLEYGDITILLRSRTYMREFYDALLSRDIPVETDEAGSLLDTYEVQTALAFLRIVDNPRNDIQLISVLRFYGFSPDELAGVRICDKNAEFYDALELYAEKSEKARLFFEHLHEFRTLAPELLADGLLWYIYNRTQLLAYMSALPNGIARRANLIQLASEARNAAGYGYSGIFEFLRYLDRLQKPINCVSSLSSGGVRIMTVHKSKGLEFPVVFLVDLAHRFSIKDTTKPLLFHQKLGAGQKLVDLQRRIEYPTLPRLAITEKIMEETKAEELRILYVAMTRAREKLIMVYSDIKPEKTFEKLRGLEYPVPPYVLSRLLSIGDVLLSVLLTRPEAGELFGEDVAPGLFDMKLVRVTPDESYKPALPEAEAAADIPEPAPSDITYAYPVAPTLPSKLTVTELKNRVYDAELAEDSENINVTRHTTPIKPDFIARESKITGSALGTALHTALQHITLREYADANELRTELASIAERGLLTPEELDVVDIVRIQHFLNSPIGKRVISADELYREFKFSLLVPAEEFFPEAEACGDKILFQGVVDLAFREGDTITVIDFKTDKLYSDNAIVEKAAYYTPQLDAYKRALKRVTGLEVREGYIYFLDNNSAVPV